MKRRDFIGSSGPWLLALAGVGAGHAAAGWLAATLDRGSRRFGSRVDLASDRSLSLGFK